jgi:hypothetical protein
MTSTTSNDSQTVKFTNVKYVQPLTITPRDKWRGFWIFVKAIPCLFKGAVTLENWEIMAAVVRGTKKN